MSRKWRSSFWLRADTSIQDKRFVFADSNLIIRICTSGLKGCPHFEDCFRMTTPSRSSFCAATYGMQQPARVSDCAIVMIERVIFFCTPIQGSNSTTKTAYGQRMKTVYRPRHFVDMSVSSERLSTYLPIVSYKLPS